MELLVVCIVAIAGYLIGKKEALFFAGPWPLALFLILGVNMAILIVAAPNIKISSSVETWTTKTDLVKINGFELRLNVPANLQVKKSASWLFLMPPQVEILMSPPENASNAPTMYIKTQ